MSATVFPTAQINSIKDQLTLAHAARGVLGDHGQQNFSNYWRPTFSHFLPFSIQLSKAKVVVTNPAVRHGTVLLQVAYSTGSHVEGALVSVSRSSMSKPSAEERQSTQRMQSPN